MMVTEKFKTDINYIYKKDTFLFLTVATSEGTSKPIDPRTDASDLCEKSLLINSINIHFLNVSEINFSHKNVM